MILDRYTRRYDHRKRRFSTAPRRGIHQHVILKSDDAGAAIGGGLTLARWYVELTRRRDSDPDAADPNALGSVRYHASASAGNVHMAIGHRWS